MSLNVVSPGLQTLVQDAGRTGYAASGVGLAGAFDRAAYRQANALVGNASDTAVLEVLAGGLRLRADGEHSLAVTGAVGPIHIDGEPAEHGRELVVFAGQELSLGTFEVGLRGYVGIGGGIDVPPVLGSRSFDTLAGLGPRPLAAADTVAVGEPDERQVASTDVPALISSSTTTVDVLIGPRDGWFSTDALARFLREPWTVSAMSNRVGIRLAGPPLKRRIAGELPSEPCVCGSVQITSAGLPVVLGPDHPVTGGYPVLAVVIDAHVDRLAQLRPGETLRFRPN